MQDNYQDINPPQQTQQPLQPQPQSVNDRLYYHEQYPDPQFYQQQVSDQTKVYASPQVPNTASSNWFDFSNPSYMKGFIVAAGITLVAANPSVQQTLIKGVLKAWSFLQGGVEEIKEQIQDVKAEMSQD